MTRSIEFFRCWHQRDTESVIISFSVIIAFTFGLFIHFHHCTLVVSYFIDIVINILVLFDSS